MNKFINDNILVADSGSTKTDWQFFDGHRVFQFKTAGFNPFFQDTNAIHTEVTQNLLPQMEDLLSNDTPHDRLKIFFYGAGCSNEQKCAVVRKALLLSFPKAEVNVDHDLLAAARALCGKEHGIAAILGTGSNSCYYDGNRIVKNVASLGFILGDEGSGAHIGKLFVQDYLNNDIPLNIADKFRDSYELSKDSILDAIYKKAMPSRFLASFSKFINENKNEQYINDLIEVSFNQFFTKHICKYPNHKEVKMNCVGSVAFHYKDALSSIASQRGVVIDKVIESPIKDLAQFHFGI